jgi:glycosyltransferase involved in cell wall biosynthesis
MHVGIPRRRTTIAQRWRWAFEAVLAIAAVSRRMTISVIVCAHNEAHYLAACLHSVLAQSRVPDEIVVVNNASTDETSVVALQIPRVRVVDEPRKGLVVARETGRRHATGEILIYLDADCRAPLTWIERIRTAALKSNVDVALTLFRNGSWTA